MYINIYIYIYKYYILYKYVYIYMYPLIYWAPWPPGVGKDWPPPREPRLSVFVITTKRS